MMKPVIIVPCFNHAKAFESVAAGLSSFNIPVIVVDDGSIQSQSVQIKKICTKHKFFYIKNKVNGGKGAAMISGFRFANEQGFSHALQIDADGQHDIRDIPLFLKTAERHIDDLIIGNPVYDKSAPKSRLVGRKITKFWVMIETFNKHMPDTMCGFRVYPLAAIMPISQTIKFKRMGFDIEIIVKAYRCGINIVSVPTKVIYPDGGVSHFCAFRDNFYISLLHTYMCFLIPVWMIKKCFKGGKMRKFVYSFLILVPIMSFAKPLTDTMPTRLKTFVDNLDDVSANFTQIKILPESTKQFKSSGRVRFVKGTGFTWHQIKPSETIFTSTLASYCLNGDSKELNELPYFHQIQNMIDEMLNGNMSDFLFAFNADYTDDKSANGWHIVATPRLTALADFIQDLTIYGTTQNLNKIIITYADGTIVILNFTRSNKVFNYEIVC